MHLKSILLPLAIVLGLSILGAPHAVASTVLSFVPENGEVTCEEELDVEIRVDAGAADLRGTTFRFTYDPTLVEFVDAFGGQLFVDAPCPFFLYVDDTPPGTVQIDIAGLGCSVDGPGAVARVRFRGVTDGLTLLEGTAATLRDSANQGIGSSWTDGQILVSCPVSGDTVTWSVLKGRLR